VKERRQGSSSFFTFFLRSSVTVGPPIARLLRTGMKMLVMIRSMFHRRVSASLASIKPPMISLWKVSSPRARLLELGKRFA
jgi:hypothetical protein